MSRTRICRVRPGRSAVPLAAALMMACSSVVSVTRAATAQNRPEARRDSILVLQEIVISDSARVFESGAVRLRRLLVDPGTAQRAASVAELLADDSLIDVRRAGLTGEATVSLRGAGAIGTPVLMDGFSLADPQTGVVDLSMIPLSQIGSVELIHGPAGHTGALGGAVVLRTRSPSTVDDGFSAAAGAFGHRTLSMSAGGRFAGIDGSVSGTTSRRDGDFPYRNTAAFPAREDIRHGAGRQVTTVSLAAGKDVAGGSVRVLSWLSDSVRGIPGPANSSGVGAVLDDRLFRLQLGLESHPGGWPLKAGVSTTRSGRTYSHPDEADRSFRGATTTARFDVIPVLRGRWMLESGLELSRAAADIQHAPRRNAATFRTGIVRSSERLTLQSTVELTSARSHAGTSDGANERTDGARESADRDLVLLPSAGVRVGVVTGLNLRASAARSFRRPTLNELYWQPGGNPDLRSEHGWMLDAGVTAERRLFSAQWFADAGIYAGRVENRITWQPAFAGSAVRVWRPVNVGRVDLRGIEGGLEGRFNALSGRWTISLHVGRFIALDHTNPDAPSWAHQLRYVPVSSASGFLAFEYGDWSVRVGSKRTGRRYTTTDESLYLDPWRVSTLSAIRSVRTKTVAIRLGFTIRNLENADYQVMRLYPMPPRHATFTLSVTSTPSDS